MNSFQDFYRKDPEFAKKWAEYYEPEKEKPNVQKFETFHYEPLPKKYGAIRLLKLMPSTMENPDVECELITLASGGSDTYRYEALSWCWGKGPKDAHIKIRNGNRVYKRDISPNLFQALKALRYENKPRFLWVDAVCIDQEDLDEKNHQVEMMYEIYGNAERVCVWLGEASESSCVALKFIEKEVLQLRDFDELCERRGASDKWRALLELMQRPWFSRRWVVQEVSLAREADIYCGTDCISWKNFAIAVELFVEVETATHRLSEVMRKDTKYHHVPGLFEYVSALGASLLVDATDRLFRDYKLEHRALPNAPDRGDNSNDEGDSGSESDTTPTASDDKSSNSDKGMSRGKKDSSGQPKSRMQPLLSLEYLVSSLTIFDTTMPHDTIYALLAIAKDTTPRAARNRSETSESSDYVQQGFEIFTQRKRYNVDYELPYVDVCKEFIQFAIERSLQIDPSRALDVICRPWATEQTTLDSARNAKEREEEREKREKRKIEKAQERRQSRKGPQTRGKVGKADAKQTPTTEASDGNSQPLTEYQDLPLPSWVPQLSAAPFSMHEHAGVTGKKMSRKNADPLVGLPNSTYKNYSAAETKKPDMRTLRFRKRYDLGHYSMYVRGFHLDTISKVEQLARTGQIPKEWTDVAGWPQAKGPPPDAFWRTLVADRGSDGKNPPVYYSRACAESFKKGGYESGAVDTAGLINYERNSVVSQFCRRVQAVIWNRALVKTGKGSLGLVGTGIKEGDKVCILYGLSVPVVLRESPKKDKDTFEKELNWELEFIVKTVRECFRRYKARKELHERRKIREMTLLPKLWLEEEANNERGWMKCNGLAEEDWKEIGMSQDTDAASRLIEDKIAKITRKALKDFGEWRIDKRAGAWALARKSSQKDTAATASDGVQERSESVGQNSDDSAKQDRPGWKASESKDPVDWWEFEYELKAGRRWKKIVANWKAQVAEQSQKRAKEKGWEEKKAEEFALFKGRRKRQGKWVESKDAHAANNTSSASPSTSNSNRELEDESASLQTAREAAERCGIQENTRAGAQENLIDLGDQPTNSVAARRGVDQETEEVQHAKAGDANHHEHHNEDEQLHNNHLEASFSASLNKARKLSGLTMQDPEELGHPYVNESSKHPQSMADTNPQGEYPSQTRAHLGTHATTGGPSNHGDDPTPPPLPAENRSTPKKPATIPDTSTVTNGRSGSFADIKALSRAGTAPSVLPSQHPEATTSEATECIRPSWVPKKKKREVLSEEKKVKLVEDMKQNLRDRLGPEGYYSYQLLGECYIHGMMDGQAMLYQNGGVEGEDEVIPSYIFELQ